MVENTTAAYIFANSTSSTTNFPVGPGDYCDFLPRRHGWLYGMTRDWPRSIRWVIPSKFHDPVRAPSVCAAPPRRTSAWPVVLRSFS